MADCVVIFFLTLLILEIAHRIEIWRWTKRFASLAKECFAVIGDKDLDDEKKEQRLQENLRQIARAWFVSAVFLLGSILSLIVFGLSFGLGIDAVFDIPLIASGCLAIFVYAIWTRVNAR